jgi:hypothetical protein
MVRRRAELLSCARVTLDSSVDADMPATRRLMALWMPIVNGVQGALSRLDYLLEQRDRIPQGRSR